jgi:hypothetical protein
MSQPNNVSGLIHRAAARTIAGGGVANQTNVLSKLFRRMIAER